VRAWGLVSVINTAANSAKSDLYGPNPKGALNIESNGLINMLSDLPNFGSNSRTTGSAEENKAVVQGSIAYFGIFSVNEADKSFTMQVESATFPNWGGTAQKRTFSDRGR
jgi:hypothetical protein